MTREEAAIDYCLFIGNTSLDEVDAFKAGAEWEHKRLVERACKWLINSFDHLHNEYHRKLEFGNQEVFIEAFKKEMDE